MAGSGDQVTIERGALSPQSSVLSPPPPADRPTIMIDLDGVIARPILGRNLAISRRLNIAPLPADVRLSGPAWSRRSARLTLRRLSHEIRYLARRPLPGAREGLAAIAQCRQILIVTGRSWLVQESIRVWLDRHGLGEHVDEVIANNTDLRTAQFKLRIARSRLIEEQIDDDGSIAYYLARNGLSRVFLIDWPRNRGLPYPPNVTVVRNLLDVAEHLSRTGTI